MSILKFVFALLKRFINKDDTYTVYVWHVVVMPTAPSIHVLFGLKYSNNVCTSQQMDLYCGDDDFFG